MAPVLLQRTGFNMVVPGRSRIFLAVLSPFIFDTICYYIFVLHFLIFTLGLYQVKSIDPVPTVHKFEPKVAVIPSKQRPRRLQLIDSSGQVPLT